MRGGNKMKKFPTSIRTWGKINNGGAEVWYPYMERSHPYWYQHRGKEKRLPRERAHLLSPWLSQHGLKSLLRKQTEESKNFIGVGGVSPLVHSPKILNNPPKPTASRFVELFSAGGPWLSFGFCCFSHSRLFNIYPTKHSLGSCMPSSPEIQSLRIIQIPRLNEDSFQRPHAPHFFVIGSCH